MTRLADQPEREVGPVAIWNRLLRRGVHRNVVRNLLIYSCLLSPGAES